MARVKRWRKQGWQRGEESIRRWGFGGGRRSVQAVQAVQVGGGGVVVVVLVDWFGGDMFVGFRCGLDGFGIDSERRFLVLWTLWDAGYGKDFCFTTGLNAALMSCTVNAVCTGPID